MLKKYAKAVYENCRDMPPGLHAHQFSYSKASHWLEDGNSVRDIEILKLL